MRLGRDANITGVSGARLRARKTLTPRFTDFFTDFEKKKTDCFAVYLSYGSWSLLQPFFFHSAKVLRGLNQWGRMSSDFVFLCSFTLQWLVNHNKEKTPLRPSEETRTVNLVDERTISTITLTTYFLFRPFQPVGDFVLTYLAPYTQP